MKISSRVFGAVFAAIILLNAAHARADLPNEVIAKATKDAEERRDKEKPESGQVIKDNKFFLNAMTKPRKGDLSGKKFTLTMAGTDNLLVACNQFAEAMTDLANSRGDDTTSEQLVVEWKTKLKEMLVQMTTRDEALFDASILSEREGIIWQQFFDEWLAEVEKDGDMQEDKTLFKDALLQAGYEITKAGLGIDTAQKYAARSEAAAEGMSGAAAASSGSRGTSSGRAYHYNVMHARQMRAIYGRHERRMAKIEGTRSRP